MTREALEGTGNGRGLVMPISFYPPLWKTLWRRAGFLWKFPNHSHLLDDLLTESYAVYIR